MENDRDLCIRVDIDILSVLAIFERLIYCLTEEEISQDRLSF